MTQNAKSRQIALKWLESIRCLESCYQTDYKKAMKMQHECSKVEKELKKKVPLLIGSSSLRKQLWQRFKKRSVELRERKKKWPRDTPN